MTEIPQQNLRNKVSVGGFTFLRPQFITYFAALIWGLFTSMIFPPVEASALVWIVLLPLLFTGRRSFALGFWFGFGHFFLSLFWLRTIHPAVVFPLAAYCAIYSGIWVLLFRRVEKYLPGALFRTFAGTVMWVMLDFLRGAILTGFPWNFLGIALWRNPDVGLIRFTGVYGETFLIVFSNLALVECLRQATGKTFKFKSIKSWLLPSAVLGLFLLTAVFDRTVMYDKADGVLRVLPVQGNIPLCRIYTEEEFLNARDTYFDLTRKGLKTEKPDLVIWPETAVPASLRYTRSYLYPFLTLVRDLNLPFLIGNVDYRTDPDRPFGDKLCYNSAMYFSGEGDNLQNYDKTHPVPFGEFVPFGERFPQLNEMLGMGRNLTAGTEFTVFSQHSPARFGVNICYEDVFSQISRNFVLGGANILMTITNDAWYHETAGSHQHFAHSVFRAMENNVYFLRSGNRSYSSLTAPDGTLKDCYKGEDGGVFVKDAKVIEIPYTKNPTKTFYTLHGDLFAKLCCLLSVIFVLYFICCWYHQKCRLLQRIHAVEDCS